MSGFHSIHDFRRSDDEQKQSEEFSQGGHQSSTAVLRPIRSGDADDISAVVDAARRQAQSGMGPVNNRVSTITVFRNGFRIGDGEFRDRNDPANQAFIQSILKGEVPQELEQKARAEFGNAQSLGIEIIDKSKEDFVAPQPSFQAFQTAGFALGSSSVVADFSGAVPREITVDSSISTTTLQIIGHDGRRHRVPVNHSHTILQLYEHVMS